MNAGLQDAINDLARGFNRLAGIPTGLPATGNGGYADAEPSHAFLVLISAGILFAASGALMLSKARRTLLLANEHQ